MLQSKYHITTGDLSTRYAQIISKILAKLDAQKLYKSRLFFNKDFSNKMYLHVALRFNRFTLYTILICMIFQSLLYSI